MIEAEDIPLTFKGFTKVYSYPPMGTLRKMVHHSDTNGLKLAFLKVGKSRLVLPKTLFRLLKEMGGQWNPKARNFYDEDIFDKNNSKAALRNTTRRKK